MARRVKEPIPQGAARQDEWARAVATGTKVEQMVSEKVLCLAPDERVQELFPKGVVIGVQLAVKAAEAEGRRIPAVIARDPKAWAAGLAQGLPIPPKAAFGRGRLQSCVAILRSGIQLGIILAFGAIGVRGQS